MFTRSVWVQRGGSQLVNAAGASTTGWAALVSLNFAQGISPPGQ
ncbi:hypothetical protein ACQEUV_33115 [Micromonospora aurantiaca (nom. illeg.)]